MNDMVTIENFSSTNRTRIVGNSMYRICRTEDDFGNWYIYELYNHAGEYGGGCAYYSDDLSSAIDRLNSFAREKEIIDLPL